MRHILSDKVFLATSATVATFLYFFNLDNYYLGLDQADYPIHALNILKYGVPYILGDDPPYFDPRFAVNGIWGYHSWLAMYLIAGSIYFFGNTTFAAVLPTAACGVLNVFAIYCLTMQTHENRWIARLTVVFYLFSVPCILYMRTSRYFGPNLLLSITCLICFIQLIKTPKHGIYPFCISAVLFFYAMHAQFFGLFFGLAVFSVLYLRDKIVIRKLIQSAVVISAFTLPWFLYFFIPAQRNIGEVYSNYLDKKYTKSAWTFFEFAVGYLAQANSYFLPIFVIIIFLAVNKYYSLDYSWNPDKTLLALSCAGMIFAGCLHSIPLFNYVLGTIPILFIFLAEMCFKIAEKNVVLGGSVISALVFTNWVHIAPWFIFANVFPAGNHFVPKESIMHRWATSIRHSNQSHYYLVNYIKEISSDFNGPLKAIASYLDKHAKPGDSFVTTHEGDSLHFYTKLRWTNDFPFKSPPQWIIPRGPRNNFSQMGRINTREESRKNATYVYQYIETYPYEKIELDVWDNGAENSYNIQNHNFSNPHGPYKATLFKYVGGHQDLK